MNKENRRNGLIHNCTKENNFVLVEAAIMKADRVLIRCVDCGAEYRETDWEKSNE